MKPIETFKTPPVNDTDKGEMRRVGFELEFSGLTLAQAVKVVQSALGGILHSNSTAEQQLSVEGLGDFNIELDWDYLKRKSAENRDEGGANLWLTPLRDAAELLVPLEVVCPPLVVDQLARLEPMISALREAGAVGTEESLLAAYGVHINPEIPRRDAATLFNYLRAFALLQWWLVEAHEVDLTRKVSPYVNLYPEAYVKCLLNSQAPDMAQLFNDYLTYNATRNRALDLLPLLAAIDSDRLRHRVNDPKIKARPTFHYRLPNCHIERPGWSLAHAWNTWCVVEALAWRPDDLATLGDTFLEMARPVLGVNRKNWIAWVDQWLIDHALV